MQPLKAKGVVHLCLGPAKHSGNVQPPLALLGFPERTILFMMRVLFMDDAKSPYSFLLPSLTWPFLLESFAASRQ